MSGDRRDHPTARRDRRRKQGRASRASESESTTRISAYTVATQARMPPEATGKAANRAQAAHPPDAAPRPARALPRDPPVRRRRFKPGLPGSVWTIAIGRNGYGHHHRGAATRAAPVWFGIRAASSVVDRPNSPCPLAAGFRAARTAASRPVVPMVTMRVPRRRRAGAPERPRRLSAI